MEGRLTVLSASRLTQMPRNPVARRKPPITHTAATTTALIELSWTVLDVFVRMKTVTDRLTAAEGQSTPRLSVLGELARRGPLSVAQVARARRVARQGVQRLADELVRDGLVTLVGNPAHRRSPLLQLTPTGRRVSTRLLARQDAIAHELAPSFDTSDVRRAIAVLQAFGDGVEAIGTDQASR
jgi:DNA-binding MarR family transcriptional regulator